LSSEINKSNLPNYILAEKYGVSKNTICKWENKENIKDKSSIPFILHYSHSDLDMLFVVQLRVFTW